MTGRVLQLILGVVLFLCSTSFGMANETTPGKARACFFDSREQVSEVVGQDETDNWLLLPQGWLAIFDGDVLSESSSESLEEELKRHKKRHSHKSAPKLLAGRVVSNSLSFNWTEKGYPRRPLSQDVRRQRAEMIRFVQLESAI